MKTTLVIDDRIMRELKQEAARRGSTISELVEAALRRFLTPPSTARNLPPLPTFKGGELLVDICDREKLDEVMDEE